MFIVVDCRAGASVADHAHFLRSVACALQHHAHFAAVGATPHLPTIVALHERGVRTVCMPRTPPHEAHRALGALVDAAAATGGGNVGGADDDDMRVHTSPLADALSQCAAAGTDAQRARVVLLSANSAQFAHDVALLGQHMHASQLHRVELHAVLLLDAECDACAAMQRVADAAHAQTSAHLTVEFARLASCAGTAERVLARVRRESSPLRRAAALVFSASERVYCDVWPCVLHLPTVEAVRVCACHGAAVAASLAADDERCAAPGKKLKAKDVHAALALGTGAGACAPLPLASGGATGASFSANDDDDVELHLVATVPLDALDETLLRGDSFAVVHSRDVRAFELAHLEHNTAIFGALAATLATRDLALVLRSASAWNSHGEECRSTAPLRASFPPAVRHFVLYASAHAAGVCVLKALAAREHVLDCSSLSAHGDAPVNAHISAAVDAVLARFPPGEWSAAPSNFHERVECALAATRPAATTASAAVAAVSPAAVSSSLSSTSSSAVTAAAAAATGKAAPAPSAKRRHVSFTAVDAAPPTSTMPPPPLPPPPPPPPPRSALRGRIAAASSSSRARVSRPALSLTATSAPSTTTFDFDDETA